MDPVEPLDESAPLAWAEAPRRCYRDPQSGDTCLWYHRVWQYLRLLGIISSIRTNTNFLTRTFRDNARTGRHPLVLVSATADYSMLAHLKSAYDQEGAALQVTVVDRCETSLMLNRWYADRYGVALATASGDVLEYAPEQPFDLICTHNFLGRFETALRSRLIAHWHALLRPGGLVVTTQRIRPNTKHAHSHYTAEEAQALSEQVTAAARTFRPRLAIDPDELGRAVYEYAIRKGAHTIRTTEEITGLFEDAGFEVELADQGGGAEERERDRPSSSAGKDTYRMRIVARKL